MGYKKGVALPEQMEKLLADCEKELIGALDIKYVCREFALPCREIMGGRDIEEHLRGCESVVLMCATLGNRVDSLIRRESVANMDKAVVLDALASAAIEQVCDEIDGQIHKSHPGKFQTSRFSCGYGDYPIEKQGDFLRLLDAPRKIGLCTAQSCALEPAKSVTAAVGISQTPPNKRRRGCAGCNMKEVCQFRKGGSHCEF